MKTSEDPLSISDGSYIIRNRKTSYVVVVSVPIVKNRCSWRLTNAARKDRSTGVGVKLYRHGISYDIIICYFSIGGDLTTYSIKPMRIRGHQK